MESHHDSIRLPTAADSGCDVPQPQSTERASEAPAKRAHPPTPPPLTTTAADGGDAPPQKADKAAGNAHAAVTTTASPRAAAPTPTASHEPKRARLAPIPADAAAARLAGVALHVAPFLPTLLDVLALREATRLPLTRDALCAHLRAVGPSALVPPRLCAYSRALNPKLWAVVLTRYVGDWDAVCSAAINGGMAAVADALDAVADRLCDVAYADGDAEQPDAQMRQLGLGYEDLSGRTDVGPPLTPRLARVVGLATGAAPGSAGGRGSHNNNGYGLLVDPLHGELPPCPPERYDIDVEGDEAGSFRDFAATACLLNASEAAAANAAALRGGLTRPWQLPAPRWIGTLAGRYHALVAGLTDAGLELRDDSVLCDAFMRYGCAGPQFTKTCSATAADDDASALAYVVETMDEMEWLHSGAVENAGVDDGDGYGSLIRSFAVYPDTYSSHAKYSEAARAVKLNVTRAYLDATEGDESGVPPSLLRDLRRVEKEGNGCGDGPAKLTLAISCGIRRGGGGGGGRRGGGGACYTCGEYGHYARDCPEDDDDFDGYDGYNYR